MARLYTVEGRPEVIKPNQLNLEFLSKQGAYIVEIKITKVNKHYPFPLIVRKENGLNRNDDNLAPGETVNMVVDNITLEDLIEFQKIEFELIRGYYWSGARDYRIQDEIRKIFNKRLEYKKQHNPLQQLYKLIMNSCYGKTIERPVEKDYKYFDDISKLERYWFKNYYKITDVMQIANSNIHANSIKHAANGDVMSLYQSIFDGNSQTFDLTQGQPCFSMNKNMTVSTVKSFIRNIKTTYDEGNRDEYFGN
ncbi:hypothetical protein M9Y10_037498 [Tritrichomonas musculus]|uniref:DNA-directed DNA polymerase n=1 Tax=Tritrichomonas musculus TaxID=1915356 RepID=A0ABR2GRJ4_9EUKA